jgi:hypothetical protein
MTVKEMGPAIGKSSPTLSFLYISGARLRQNRTAHLSCLTQSCPCGFCWTEALNAVAGQAAGAIGVERLAQRLFVFRP